MISRHAFVLAQGFHLLLHQFVELLAFEIGVEVSTAVLAAMAPKRNKGERGEAHERGMEIQDLASVWDSSPDVRARLRGGQFIMHPHSGLNCDNSVCVLNKALLMPILSGMFASNRKLPCVQDLRREITACYELNKRAGPEVNQSVAGDGIHIRKLLSFVKAKCRREEVSTELWLPLRKQT